VSGHFIDRKDPAMKTIVTITIALFAVSAFSLRGADPKTNWANNCAQCHGSDGRANTKMGKQLSAKDLTDPKVQASFSDAEAARVIKEGVKQGGKTTMKAFGGKLTDDEIKALVAYTRSLKK
jgi:mono/diheme cytochrome c family protein